MSNELVSQHLSTERVQLVDVAKGLGILLVLYGHAIEFTFSGAASVGGPAFMQWQAIYSFHMPLFFFLSGINYRQRGRRAEVNYAVRLILLAYVTHVVGGVVGVCVGALEPTIRNLLYPFLKGTGFSIVVTWFLVTLAFVRILFSVFESGALPVKMLVTFLIVSLFVIKTVTWYNYFGIGTLLPGFLFYWIGFQSRTILTRAVPGFSYWGLGALLLGVGIALAPMNLGCPITIDEQCSDVAEEFGVLLNTGRIGFIPTFIIDALLGVFGTVAIALAVTRTSPRFASALALTGSRTLSLFLMNGFFMVFVQPKLRPLLPDDSKIWLSTCWAVSFTIIQLRLFRYWEGVARLPLRYNKLAADIVVAKVYSLLARRRIR